MQFIKTNEAIDYDQALVKMHKIVDKIIEEDCNDTIWFLEHRPVYTVGYTTYDEFLLKYGSKINNIPVIKSERGGKITFHGPGQRICYLMINIKRLYNKIDLHRFLNGIHHTIIKSLEKFNINGIQDPEYPGVWIAHNHSLYKIAAIGMKIRKGVSYHGFAININNDIKNFEMINPCGIIDAGRSITSMQKILEKTIKIDLFDEILQYELRKTFCT